MSNERRRTAGADLLAAASDELVEEAMRLAMAAARVATRPFGAALVDVFAATIPFSEGNSTLADYDLFAHAEMNVLRAGIRAGVDMRRHLLVSTAEPCPMCASAAVLSGIGGIVYGTTITTLHRLGWPQILIPLAEITSRSTEPDIPVRGAVLEQQTDALYQAHVKALRR